MKKLLGKFYWIPILAAFSASVFGQTLQQKRQYEPVVMDMHHYSSMKTFENVPVDELYLYAFNSASGSWSMMPFQIDEVTRGVDPMSPNVTDRGFYFIPGEWDIDSHDGVLSDYDELVFMIRDLGDKAAHKDWIGNAESATHQRLEIVVNDPADNSKTAYAYLYRSASITEEVPTPYNFSYDAEDDKIETVYYQAGFNEFGVVDDVAIMPPGGNGQDIFDRIKLRFDGVFNSSIPIPLSGLSEEALYLYPETIQVTEKPVVRLLRQVEQGISILGILFDEYPFRFTTEFFPFSGHIETGGSISDEELSEAYPDAELSLLMTASRQSWDLNANASGMTLHNAHNQNIAIDGQSDNVNKTVDIPIRAWSVVTGTPGSILFFTQLDETSFDSVSLYYHDSKSGGEADLGEGKFEYSEDTGDDKSYGDHGIVLENSSGKREMDLGIDLLIYFLPEKNMSKSDGATLTDCILNPAEVSVSVIADVDQSDVQLPGQFRLMDNYPNPFNPETHIAFELAGTEDIELIVTDLNGRVVRILESGSFRPGRYESTWNGTDESGNPAASGVYIYRLNAGRESLSGKMLLLQ